MAYQSISVDHHGDDQEAGNINEDRGVGILHTRPKNKRRFFSIILASALIGICYYLVHHNNGSIGSSSSISTGSYTSRVHKQLDNGHLPPLPTGV